MKSNRPPRSRAFTIISILIVTMIILSMVASAISLVQ
jgi:type II secretory pathway pseudopilin PulG